MDKKIEIYSNDGQTLAVPDWTAQTKPSFDELCAAIGATHDAAQGAAVKAINCMQTMRNWLIGYYIVEFEQKGKERAEYGARLLKEIVLRVDRKGINETLLKNARAFYVCYPQMVENLLLSKSSTLSHKLEEPQESPTPSDDLLAMRKSPTSSHQLETSGEVPNANFKVENTNLIKLVN